MYTYIYIQFTCRAKCVRNELRSASSLPHIKQRKKAFGYGDFVHELYK